MGRGDPRARGRSSASPHLSRSTAARSRRGRRSRPTREILDWVARDAETALHPSCTCRMGLDAESVVDPQRCAFTASTASASSTPPSSRMCTNGNLYAPVMMVAENAADLIPGNTLLPPSTAPFYRHA